MIAIDGAEPFSLNNALSYLDALLLLSYVFDKPCEGGHSSPLLKLQATYQGREGYRHLVKEISHRERDGRGP